MINNPSRRQWFAGVLGAIVGPWVMPRAGKHKNGFPCFPVASRGHLTDALQQRTTYTYDQVRGLTYIQNGLNQATTYVYACHVRTIHRSEDLGKDSLSVPHCWSYNSQEQG